MILTVICTFLILGWIEGYRHFGDGRSEIGWLTMGLPHLALSSYGLHYVWGVSEWYYFVPLVLTTYLSVMFIRKFNPWGEFFANTKSIKNLSDIPDWMMSLINRVAGYEYKHTLGTEKMIFWKQTGWVVRHATFGLFSAVVLGVLFQTIAPVLLAPLMGAGVAYTNRLMIIRPVDKGEDGFVKGEKSSGFVTGLSQVCGIM